ncbi:MAG: L,D-transpeptidase family protein [Rhizobiaceae bacterium]|nr:L,D-transpeptidase family protein [Rhizobiaceae bacterium]
MKSSRRSFLSGSAALAAALVAGKASAQDAVTDILNSSRRGNWDDQFDAVSQAGDVQSRLPIFSPQTISYVQQAIGRYQGIVTAGGWPDVPATKKLQLGVIDPDVEALRRRLMVSGDLSPNAGLSQSFDTYVDAAVKRFQARHGLPADGVMGTYSFKAMNVSAQVRLGQLETNLVRLQTMSNGFLGDRYVVVNVPAAQIEAVENGRVVQRHTAIVGKIDRQTPLLNSKINEIIVNPYWNAPVSIVRKDIIPLMRKNPNYLTENHIRILGPNGEIDPKTIDWSTEDAAQFRFRQDPGAINAMASVKINFPSPENVYMHDTPSQGLFNKLMRFDSSGCVRVQNVRDLVVWLLRDTPGWNRQHFEQVIKGGENTPVAVVNPVPVYFTYISAWSTGDKVVHFRDDIYARDGVSELQISSAQ